MELRRQLTHKAGLGAGAILDFRFWIGLAYCLLLFASPGPCHQPFDIIRYFWYN
jgi:hypothetical protein